MGRARNFKFNNNEKKKYFLFSVDMLAFDEISQSSAEILATFDIILQETSNSNIYMGGVLIIFSMDYTKINTIGGHKFLTSCHIISCLKMVTLKNYARDSNDGAFKRIYQISRFNN